MLQHDAWHQLRDAIHGAIDVPNSKYCKYGFWGMRGADLLQKTENRVGGATVFGRLWPVDPKKNATIVV
ncbi:MAG: hypothetical protein KGK08_02400 [Acidobacteriota bacterium]|nr:hypothetical protein [Acidobacteriota bacterium]